MVVVQIICIRCCITFVPCRFGTTNTHRIDFDHYRVLFLFVYPILFLICLSTSCAIICYWYVVSKALKIAGSLKLSSCAEAVASASRAVNSSSEFVSLFRLYPIPNLCTMTSAKNKKIKSRVSVVFLSLGGVLHPM